MDDSVYERGYPHGAILRLQSLIDEIHPALPISIGRWDDRSSWVYHAEPDPDIDAIFAAFDPWSPAPSGASDSGPTLEEVREAYEDSHADDGDAGAVDSDPADIDPSGDIGEPVEAPEDDPAGGGPDYSAEPVGDDSALGEPSAYSGVMISGDPLKAAQMEATWAVGDKEEALVSQYAADENLARLNEMRGIALAIKEGVHPPFDEETAAELQALETFASWLSSVRANADRLRNAIRAADSIEAVQVIDLELGWPE